MSDFKIGKIRFTWKGAWSASYAYVKDDVVRYGAKAYVCMITHTSLANFNTDLQATPTKWNEMVDGFEWTGNWAATTFYQLNDLVKYSGIVYRCTTSHTSAATLESNIANWTIHVSLEDWSATWTTSTYYNVNDLVRYGGIVYRCNTAHTSAATAALGLEANQASWTVVHDGIEWKGPYATATRYKKGDLVRYGGSTIWYCATGHTSAATINETNFNVWLPGFIYEAEWDNATAYEIGDVVHYGGYVYRAIANNLSTVPSTNPASWSVVVEQYNLLGEWASGTAYKVGDTVIWSGSLYVAIINSLAIEPPNATYWREAIRTDRFRGRWTAYDAATAPYNYVVGDVITFQSSAYICVLKHQAALNNRPDDDVQGNYWAPFALGQESNVLKLLGDMKSYGVTDDGSTIGPNRVVIGSESTGLKVVDGTAQWQAFDQVPKVFYVSPIGSNSVDRGLTQDLPFLTIKYACDYILADQATRAPATIFVKSGVYEEILPIKVPAGCSIVGDELRNPTVKPASGYTTSDMFHLRNGTTIRNMTLEGLSGSLGSPNAYLTSRPTAGAYASLDPGLGSNDSTVWITTKSPYVQNVTTFGTGCIGLKVDGNLHNSGNKSIVANDFTQVLSDGIGAWVTNNGRAELVSVFTYYNHIGYLAENNGKIRATNGNNSYGDYGTVAEGDDPTEIPKTALVNNRSAEATVDFVFADGTEIVRYEFANCGTDYTSATSTISGTGVSAAATHDEFRDQAVYQVRIAAPGDSSAPGGGGYVRVEGNAQAGTTTQITLSATDSNLNSTYVGMRIIITSGLGVGQTAYITSYNSTTKIALVSNEESAVSGWGHIIPGTAIQATLDTTSAYSIEPRLTFPQPTFSTTARTASSAANWSDMAYGNGSFVAVAAGSTSSMRSTNGTTWTAGGALPASTNWRSIAAGAISGTTRHVAVSATSGTQAAYSANGGVSWTASTLSATATWSNVAYGDSRFVAIASGGTATSISTNGTTWAAGGALPSSTTWNSVVYGNGKFVAIAGGASSSDAAAYSTDGVTWTASTLPSSTTWTSVAYGNGRFVAIAQGGTNAAYSLDGITWTASTLPSSSSWWNIRYGQGTFIAIGGYGPVATTDIATSNDGITWTARVLPASAQWYALAFGNPSSTPIWAVISYGATTAASIPNFTPARARAEITAGKMSAVRIIDPGSGYTTNPVLTITDPTNTSEVTTEVRVGNGAIANPSFANRGTAYVTASATLTGNGYADNFQTGRFVYVTNLTALPGPGANLDFATIADQTYSVVSIDQITGTAPNINCRIRITPTLGVDESPVHGEAIEIREQYSQCRITGHDFLEIGTGTQAETNYPATNLANLAPENEVVQNGGGRVFYTSTDQDGNFRVGELFEVEQSTGVVTINADAFNLAGLTELRLGGVTLGGTGATVNEFSTDATFSANSNNIVPTQKAVKAYIASRIGGGGSDLDVNEIQIGSITVDSPNDIANVGGTAATINISQVSNFKQNTRGFMLANAYFKLGF